MKLDNNVTHVQSREDNIHPVLHLTLIILSLMKVWDKLKCSECCLKARYKLKCFKCFQCISRKLNIIEFPGWFKSMCWIEQVIYYIAPIDRILLNDVALITCLSFDWEKCASETWQCKYYTTDCTWQYYKIYFQDNIVSYRIHSRDGTIIKIYFSLGSLNELPNSQEEQSDHLKSWRK